LIGSLRGCESSTAGSEQGGCLPFLQQNIEAIIGDLAAAGLISVIATLRPLLTYKTRLSKWPASKFGRN
jgi:hypothetical protein